VFLLKRARTRSGQDIGLREIATDNGTLLKQRILRATERKKIIFPPFDVKPAVL
jgi:hypothetical protein